MGNHFHALLLCQTFVLLCWFPASAQDLPQLFIKPEAAAVAKLDADAILDPRFYSRAVVLELNAQALMDAKDGARFGLNVLDVKDGIVTLSAIETPAAESKAWRGQFEHGNITLVVRQGATRIENRIERERVVVGSLRTDGGKVIQIRPLDGNLLLFQELDVDKLPKPLEPLVPNVELRPVAGDDSADAAESAKAKFYEFDVAVFYTEDAKNGAGGTSQIKAVIDLAIVEANTAYSASGINARLNLVFADQVDDDESGSFSGMLSRLQNTSDGNMDEIHAERDKYRADLVALICEDTANCGLAYRMATESRDFNKFAFSVISRTCATGYYSFAHELGHNMGCCHDAANPSSNPIFPYAYGWHFDVGGIERRTIMAYAPGIRIQRLSNPNVNDSGVATGMADEADNARTIRNTADTVVTFRESERCVQIAVEIKGHELDIQLLQEELRTASPGLKPFLVREIKRLKGEVSDLEKEGSNLGCRLP